MLFAVAILTGVLTTLVIRWTTRPGALAVARNRIYGHLLEFRLFFDEPRLIWRAQVQLIRDNLRVFRLLLPAILILALPMSWIVVELDTRYGARPLRPGEVALVTVQCKSPIVASDRFELSTSDVVWQDSPPVRVFSENRVVWRIRAKSLATPAVHVTCNGKIVEPRRVSLAYPKTADTIPWQVRFVLVSAASALITTRTLPLR
jgi:hypothetical protein